MLLLRSLTLGFGPLPPQHSPMQQYASLRRGVCGIAAYGPSGSLFFPVPCIFPGKSSKLLKRPPPSASVFSLLMSLLFSTCYTSAFGKEPAWSICPVTPVGNEPSAGSGSFLSALEFRGGSSYKRS